MGLLTRKKDTESVIAIGEGPALEHLELSRQQSVLRNLDEGLAYLVCGRSFNQYRAFGSGPEAIVRPIGSVHFLKRSIAYPLNLEVGIPEFNSESDLDESSEKEPPRVVHPWSFLGPDQDVSMLASERWRQSILFDRMEETKILKSNIANKYVIGVLGIVLVISAFAALLRVMANQGTVTL